MPVPGKHGSSPPARISGCPRPPTREPPPENCGGCTTPSQSPIPNIVDSIRLWSAGAPAYQWIELINNRAFTGAPLTPFAHRVYTYVALAMYDATEIGRASC